MTYGNYPPDAPHPRYRPLVLDADFPVPLIDLDTGRLVHADACHGSDEVPEECVCGLDDALLDATRLRMEFESRG